MRSLLRTLFGLIVGGLGARLLGMLGRFHVGAARPRTVTRRGFVRNAALASALIILAEIGIEGVCVTRPHRPRVRIFVTRARMTWRGNTLRANLRSNDRLREGSRRARDEHPRGEWHALYLHTRQVLFDPQ